MAWNPLEVGLALGVAAAVVWGIRVAWIRFHISGPFMLFELRFWRSLLTNSLVVLALGSVVFSTIAAVPWLLLKLAGVIG